MSFIAPQEFIIDLLDDIRQRSCLSDQLAEVMVEGLLKVLYINKRFWLFKDFPRFVIGLKNQISFIGSGKVFIENTVSHTDRMRCRKPADRIVIDPNPAYPVSRKYNQNHRQDRHRLKPMSRDRAYQSECFIDKMLFFFPMLTPKILKCLIFKQHDISRNHRDRQDPGDHNTYSDENSKYLHRWNRRK